MVRESKTENKGEKTKLNKKKTKRMSYYTKGKEV
jgi:hypothetical protein